jgi:hypothetical protein
MNDRADEIAHIKVRLEEMRQALERIHANPDLTDDEQSLLAHELRREMLNLEHRWREILLRDRCSADDGDSSPKPHFVTLRVDRTSEHDHIVAAPKHAASEPGPGSTAAGL